ncbi:MAG: hypothetical protein AAGI17_08560, partial [Planctomycetota bacterium]
AEALARFFERAHVQRDIAGVAGEDAAPGRGHVVPIHEIGFTPDGAAFCVSDRYSSSARAFARAKVRLEPHVIYEIASGLVGATRKLWEGGKRPHGDLDASHVRIDTRGGIGRLRVGLTGLAAGSALSSDLEREKVRDLRAIGRVLHELVLHEPFGERSVYPVVDGSAWQALGKRGSMWLTLTNRLLDPRLMPGALAIDQIADAVAALKAKQASPTPFIVGGGIATIAAVAAVGVLLFQLRERGFVEPPPAEYSQTEFARWCTSSEEWLLPLSRAATDGRLGELTGSAYFRDQVVGLLNRAAEDRVALDPLENTRWPGGTKFRFDGNRSTYPDQIEPKGPVVVSGERGRTLGGRTDAALKVYDGISDAVEAWPARSRLTELSAAWRERGWESGADELDRIASDALTDVRLPEDSADEPVQDLARVVQTDQAIDRIEAVWTVLVSRIDAIAAAGASPAEGVPEDPLLLAFERFVELEVAGANASTRPVASLDEKLQSLNGLSTELSEFLTTRWPRVHREQFARDALAVASFTATPVPSREKYQSWMEEAKRSVYDEIDPSADPRLNWEQPDVLADASGKLLKLRADFGDEADITLAPISERLGFDLDDALLETSDQIADVCSLDFLFRTAPDIERRVQQLSRRVALLDDAVTDGDTQLRREPSEVIADIDRPQGLTGGRVPAIDDAYRTIGGGLRDGYLESGDSRPLRLGESRLRRFLRDLDERIPAVTIEPAAALRGYDAASMTEALDARRNAEIADVISATPWDAAEGRFAVTAGTDRQIEDASGNLSAFASSAEAAVEAYAEADRLLAEFYLPDETDAAGTSIDAVDGRWRGSDVLASAPARRSLDAVLERLDRVREVLALSDESRLVAAASSEAEDASASWAAYARLGDLNAWPSTIAQLEDDARGLARVSGAAESIGDDARRASVTASLDAIAQDRWVRGFSSASTEEDVRRAAALRGTFDADLSALAARPRFNAELATLQVNASEERRVSEPELRAELMASWTAHDAAAGDGGFKPDVSDFLQELRELAEPVVDESQFDTPDEVGPGKVGWEPPTDDKIDYRSIVYSYPSNADPQLQLEFIFVEVPGGDRIYLSRDEVSVGMFVDIATAANPTAPLDGMRWQSLPKTAQERSLAIGSQNWIGTRSWAWRPRPSSMIPGETWLRRHEQVGASLDALQNTAPQYPESLVDPRDPGRMIEDHRITRDSPMVRVSPAAASRLAELAGCRLPTAEEWQAAYIATESGVPLDQWNLRDQSFIVQRDWVRQVHDAIERPNLDYPDAGIAPWPAGAAGRDAAAHPFDDGTLWFEPVTAERGNVFRHLVGNAGEIVAKYNADGGLAAVSMIGGSALSPFDATVSAPHPFTGNRRRVLINDFADLGFRLAFSANRLRWPLIRRARWLAEDAPFRLSP